VGLDGLSIRFAESNPGPADRRRFLRKAGCHLNLHAGVALVIGRSQPPEKLPGVSPKPKRSSITTTGIVVLPTCDEIAARAHELFVADGRRVSRLTTHWERAEQELLDRAFKRLLTSTPADDATH